MSIESLNKMDELMTQFDFESSKEKIIKLEAMNAKLLEAVNWYAVDDTVGSYARKILDQVEVIRNDLNN